MPLSHVVSNQVLHHELATFGALRLQVCPQMCVQKPLARKRLATFHTIQIITDIGVAILQFTLDLVRPHVLLKILPVLAGEIAHGTFVENRVDGRMG